MVKKKIGVYANWGVVDSGDGIYISPIHARYIDELLDSGYEVLLLSKKKKGIEPGDSFFLNGAVRFIPIPYFASYFSGARFFFSIVGGFRVLLKNCDLIYIRTFEPFSWVLFLINFNRSKLYYHVIANPISAIMSKKSDRFLVRLVKLCVFYPEYFLTLLSCRFSRFSCNGESVLKELPKFLVKNIKVVVESSLAPNDFCERVVFEQDRVRFLYVGYLRSAKGVDVLIRAFEDTYNKSSIKPLLTVVGSGDQEKNLIAMAAEKKLDINFMGYIPSGAKLNSIYRENDVLVMPSFSETGPRVLLEAMANSLYCISTRVGYAPFVLSEDRGCLVEISDVDELARAMERCIYGNKNILKSAIEKSYEFSKQFTLKNFFRSVLNNEEKI